MAALRLPAWLPPLPWTPEPTRPQPTRPAEIRPRRQPRNPLSVSLQDRWYVLGFTGSGKTRFAKRLVRELRSLYPHTNLYALDSKGQDDFVGWPALVPTQDPPRALTGSGQIQVWQPPDDDTADYDTWLGDIKEARRPAVVLIDELSSMGGNGGLSYPPNLAKLLKQGRSMYISLVILTQESAYIPRQVAKQTTHLCYFGLSPDDEHGIKQMCKLLGFPQPRAGDMPPAPRDTFGFFYRRLLPKPERVEEYSGLQEFFDEE